MQMKNQLPQKKSQ